MGGHPNGASVEVLDSGVVRVSYQRGGIVIAMRGNGNVLAVTLRMAQSLYQGATGDLIRGCPGNEISRNQGGRFSLELRKFVFSNYISSY